MHPEPLPLRDIHLPPPVSWWPPAPGWWGLLAIAVALVALSLWLRHRLRRSTVRRTALRELAALERDPALSPSERLQRLSTLLRRAALSIYPRDEVAGLTGDDWLHFLDRAMDTRQFSQGAGRLLLEAPYRAFIAADDSAKEGAILFALCRQWISQLPAKRR